MNCGSSSGRGNESTNHVHSRANRLAKARQVPGPYMVKCVTDWRCTMLITRSVIVARLMVLCM